MLVNYIHRVTAEVHVPGASDGTKAQDQAAAFVHGSLLPAIERVTDRFNVGEQTVRINTIELDALHFKPGFDNSAAIRNFEQMLEDKIARILQQAGKNTEAKSLTREENLQELFIYLLQHGVLPWWAAGQSIRLHQLAEDCLQQPTTNFAAQLVSTLSSTDARQRAMRQLNTDTKERLLKLVNPQLEKWLTKLSGPIRAILTSQNLFWQTVLNPAVEQPTLARIIQKVLTDQPRASAAVLSQLKTEMQKLVPTEAKGLDAKSPNDDLSAMANTDSEKFHVLNAGLVILAPFLPQFFNQLGLLHEHQFIDAFARQRAVCLLQYLATGTSGEFDEHDLVLNKVLCGHPLYQPLDAPFEATEQELEETNKLLQAVAQNWTALKNTSPESMRNAFFMRNGLVERMGHGWNLKVERHAIDILVDKLPWGISVIKLPWNAEAVFVDWT